MRNRIFFLLVLSITVSSAIAAPPTEGNTKTTKHFQPFAEQAKRAEARWKNMVEEKYYTDPWLLLTGGTLTGTLNGTTAIFSGNLFVNASVPFARLSVGNNVGIGEIGGGADGDLDGRDGLVFQTNNGTYIGAAVSGKRMGTYGVDLLFGTRASGGDNIKERMRITNAGNIGIGIDSPLLAKLHVNQDGSSLSLTTVLIKDNSVSPASGKDVLKIIGRDNAGTSYLFRVQGNNGLINGITVTDMGLIGLGTNSPTEKLTVDGNVYATGNISAYGQLKTKKVVVTQTLWPDYVFDKKYKLRSLASLANFVDKNKHLPGIPSAKEVEDGGLNLGDTQALLLKKVEELTLYIIQLNKKIDDQKIDFEKKLKAARGHK